MKKNKDSVLIPDENELPGLLLAFESYAQDKYSDNDIAKLLNEAGYLSKTGRPFSKETIRDMLQNQTYLGKIKYQKYKRRSNGSRSFEAPVEWYDGQHEAVISEGVFELCQKVRAKRRSHRMTTQKYQPYLLRTLVYCHNCCSNPPDGKTFRLYGMMRPQSQSQGSKYQYYRCRSKELGYECKQKSVRVDAVDEQVISVLMNLQPPEGWRKGITESMGRLLGEKNLEERLVELQEIIKRIDLRWDNGFFTNEQEYIQKRLELQMELEKLTPVPDDDLEQAADLLTNFKSHWERLEGDDDGRHDLVKLIVERVYVRDKQVVAMTLRSKYHLVLGHKTNGPTYFEVDPFLYRSGSDGLTERSGRRCIVLMAREDSHFKTMNLLVE